MSWLGRESEFIEITLSVDLASSKNSASEPLWSCVLWAGDDRCNHSINFSIAGIGILTHDLMWGPCEVHVSVIIESKNLRACISASVACPRQYWILESFICDRIQNLRSKIPTLRICLRNFGFVRRRKTVDTSYYSNAYCSLQSKSWFLLTTTNAIASVICVCGVNTTWPDTRLIPVADGWARAEMRFFCSFELDRYKRTNGWT